MLRLLACTASPTFSDAQISVATAAATRLEGDRLMAHVEALVTTRIDEDPYVPPGGARADEIVLVSAHHDAWFFGADDNATGVAVILEFARVLPQVGAFTRRWTLAHARREHVARSRRRRTAHDRGHLATDRRRGCHGLPRRDDARGHRRHPRVLGDATLALQARIEPLRSAEERWTVSALRVDVGAGWDRARPALAVGLTARRRPALACDVDSATGRSAPPPPRHAPVLLRVPRVGRWPSDGGGHRTTSK